MILKQNFQISKAFIVNNKIDLNIDKEYRDKINTYKNINIKIIDCSVKYGNTLKNWIITSKENASFVGNSGAGKSTLTSKIIGKDLKTNESPK